MVISLEEMIHEAVGLEMTTRQAVGLETTTRQGTGAVAQGLGVDTRMSDARKKDRRGRPRPGLVGSRLTSRARLGSRLTSRTPIYRWMTRLVQ